MTQYFPTFAFTAFEIEMHLVIMKQFISFFKNHWHLSGAEVLTCNSQACLKTRCLYQGLQCALPCCFPEKSPDRASLSPLWLVTETLITQ